MSIVWHNTPSEITSNRDSPHILRFFGLCLFMLSLPFTPLHSQNTMSWDDFVAYLEDWMETPEFSEEENSIHNSWTEQLEELYLLHQHPLDVNTATKDELAAIPILSERQASDIHSHVVRYKGMRSLNELVLIPSISYYERKVLRLFLKVNDTQNRKYSKQTFRNMLKQHHHEFVTRLDIPLYHRKGFLIKPSTSSQSSYYIGSRIYNKMRYDFSTSRHILLNLHTERDAGEKGIDSYGGALMLRDLGCLSTLALGDFKASFGEGLVINQTFSMGRSTPLAKVNQGLRINGGTTETDFLRGAGLTFRWGEVTATAFASRTQHDATLNEDGTVKTILTTGYHRTPTECSKKNILDISSIGGNLSWNHKGWHTGATAYFQYTSRSLEPGTKAYRTIYPHGQRFTVMGVNYGYDAYRWLLKGETAFSTEQQGLATLHTLSIRLTPDYRLTASQRYYSRRYYSSLASALSSQGKVQNETGASIRLDASPFTSMQLTAFTDFFYHPWPRYGVPHSSRGIEGVLEMLLTLNRNNTFAARYSVLNKEYSTGQTTHHRMKVAWKGAPTQHFNWNVTAMLHTLSGSTGIALATTLKAKDIIHNHLQTAFTTMYFHTDDYQSRISLYESNVAGMVYIPTLSGHGIRLTGNARYSLWQKHIQLELKYGITRYFDRKIQSSGLQTIYSPVKNDITLQLRFHF